MPFINYNSRYLFLILFFMNLVFSNTLFLIFVPEKVFISNKPRKHFGMKEKPGRRSFIKNVGIGSISAAIFPVGSILPGGIANVSDEQEDNKELKKQTAEKKERPYNTAYKGEYLNRVAFPVGGLGAGMFCMEGTGVISHISVRNKPEIFNEPGIFAAISVKGIKNGAKLLEGPVPGWKKFGQPDAGNGSGGATTGLPHFRSLPLK